jgi:hypothetical protein
MRYNHIDHTRRMKRRLLNYLTALSLLLCVAVVGLWVRSYSCRDRFMFTSMPGRAIIRTPRGHLAFGLSLGGDWSSEWGIQFKHGAPPEDPTQLVDDFLNASEYPFTLLTGCGFTWLNSAGQSYSGFRSFYVLVIPCWSACVVFSTLPAIFVIRRLVSRAAVQKHHCRECGYDLCATPDRCPECGAVAASQEV